MFTRVTLQIKKVIIFLVLKNGIYCGAMAQNLLYTWIFKLAILILGMNIMQVIENVQAENMGQMTQGLNTDNAKRQKVQGQKIINPITDVPAKEVGNVVNEFIISDGIKCLVIKEDNNMKFTITPITGAGNCGFETRKPKFSHTSDSPSEEQQTLYGKDENSEKIQVWLNREKENCEILDKWLGENRVKNGTDSITNILYSKEYGALRVEIMEKFEIR
ncbi:MAG: hypothetical protein NG747_10625 [Candidatus Brocadia sp.]|nr:hypothetical protein [Candidatus Brocadia sp.]